jgi:hypothetical protein
MGCFFLLTTLALLFLGAKAKGEYDWVSSSDKLKDEPEDEQLMTPA